MTTVRETLFEAILARLTGVEGLPPCTRNEDDPRTEDYVPVNADAGADPSYFLSLLDEGIAKQDEPVTLGPAGPIYEWDLNLIAAFAVRATDKDIRVSLKDAGVAALAAALLPDALDEPARHRPGGANWMWVEAPEPPTAAFDANVPLAITRIPIRLWFSAANPAA